MYQTRKEVKSPLTMHGEQMWEERVRELEKKISQLRTGRRILMNLLEIAALNQKRQIERLQRENHELKRRNRRYAARILFLQEHVQREGHNDTYIDLAKDCRGNEIFRLNSIENRDF
jgi:hypothetical protein